MTKNWQPAGDEWAGQSVAILASGPSMSDKVAGELRAKCDHVVVVNDALLVAPWADMLVAIDGNWAQNLRDFGQMRVTGCPDDELDALYIGMVSTRVGSLDIRNSTLEALKLVARMGVTSIIVAGFEPEVQGHFYDQDQPPPTYEYIGVREGFEMLAAQLRGQGIAVDAYEPAAPRRTVRATPAPTAAPQSADGEEAS